MAGLRGASRIGVICQGLRGLSGAGRSRLILTGILLLAAFLRAFNNTTSFYSFWVDEATYANRSIYIVDHGGRYDTAELFDHPPLFMYLQALFFLLFGSEWYVARGLSVFLGVITVLLVFLAGREWKGEKVGLLLAALFAVQTLVVRVNRQVMIENLLILLMAVFLLGMVKYEKTGRPRFLYMAALFLGLSLITKLTALVLIPALLAYAAVSGLHRQRALYIAGAITASIAIPVLILMLPHGFIGFHIQKAGWWNTGIWMGNTSLNLGYASALVLALAELNAGAVAFLVFLWPGRKGWRASLGLSRMRGWAVQNRLTFLLLVWALGSLLVFSLLTFLAEQYILTVLFPVLVLLGLVLQRCTRRLTAAVMATYLVCTCIFIAAVGMPASDETVAYLRPRVAPGDVLVASDAAVLRYYFPENSVLDATADRVATVNATYLVLKVDFWEALGRNGTVAPVLTEKYIPVFQTHEGTFAVNFVVLQRTG